MFTLGAKVICMLQVTAMWGNFEVLTVDSKAEGIIKGVGTELLIVDFSKYTNANHYIGKYNRIVIQQGKCVPIN